jgi:hypothetical protein
VNISCERTSGDESTKDWKDSRGRKRKSCDDDSDSPRSSSDPEIASYVPLSQTRTRQVEMDLDVTGGWESHPSRSFGDGEDAEDSKPAAYWSAGQLSSISSDGITAVQRERLRGMHAEGRNRDAVTDTSSSSGKSVASPTHLIPSRCTTKMRPLLSVPRSSLLCCPYQEEVLLVR